MAPHHIRPRRAITACGLALVAACVAPGVRTPIGRTAAPVLAQRIDSALRVAIVDSTGPGVSVAVLRHDTLVFLGGRGSANPARRTPITGETIFQLASTTKPFTAMAVMMLVDDGTIALDAPISRWLSWLPPAYAPLTIRQLLTHTSGVARDLRRANVDEFSEAEFRVRLAASVPSFAPGARWEYANTGYALLSFVVEAASGERFGDFLRRRIFLPLGMRATAYRAPHRIDALHATGFDLVDGAVRPAPYVFSGFGNSGIESTASDLARWAAAIERGALLRPESWRLVFSRGVLATGDTADFEFAGARSGYGFGWFLTTWRGTARITHGGAIAGFSATVDRYPERGWTIVALSNRKEASPRVGQATVVADAIAGVLEIAR